uniref:WRKY19-like zinc finger domain-containing protein n=1 Tax=Globisporangium ultimum (strain ATCC 200006 / CBS 805.95 / DAOM BR144) TaxID=431595 RepID=K3WCD2_GLOUD
MEPGFHGNNPPLRGLCDEEVDILGHLLLENHTFEDELFPAPLAMYDNASVIRSEPPSPELLPNSLSSSFMDLMAPLQAAEFSFRDAYNGTYGPASSYQSDVYMNNEETHELDHFSLDPPRPWSRLPARKPVHRRHGYSGRTCAVPDCGKSSQGRGLCIRHGGGKRCSVEGCIRGAQATGRCKAHGGGVRCKVDGCVKSSQGSGLCRTHGGGKICLFPGCKKGTQRGGKCSTHGGSRICMADGCTKVDRGGGLCGIHKKTMNSSNAQ